MKTEKELQDKIILDEEDIQNFIKFPIEYTSLFASIEVKNDILEKLTKRRGLLASTHINKFSKLKIITVKLEPGKINKVKLHKPKTLENVFIEGDIIKCDVNININVIQLKSIRIVNCNLIFINFGNKNFDTLNIVDCNFKFNIKHVLKNIKNISLVNCKYIGNLTNDLYKIGNRKLEEIKLSSMNIENLSICKLINTNPNLDNIKLQNIDNINNIIDTFKKDYENKKISNQKVEKIIFNFIDNNVNDENLDWLEKIDVF